VLTAMSSVILQKIISSQLVKKFAAIYGTRSFITAFTKASHTKLYYAILNKVAWLLQKMGHFRFSRVWEQILTLSFMIWNHIRLLIFLNIALLQCTVRVKCRYFRNNWKIWRNYNVSKQRKNYSLNHSPTVPSIQNIYLFVMWKENLFHI